MPVQGSTVLVRLVPLLAAAGLLLAACEATEALATPPIVPGTSASPRAVNVIARDYSFSPPVIDLVPGETVTVRLVNGGQVVHEAVFGAMEVQDAWERAEAATVGHPPGPTPVVSVSPEVAGVRIVAESGQRTDLTWTVPDIPAEEMTSWYVGCHIPGHWSEGMLVPVRFVGADGRPLASPAPLPGSPAAS